jgi:hypothetical protein
LWMVDAGDRRMCEVGVLLCVFCGFVVLWFCGGWNGFAY